MKYLLDTHAFIWLDSVPRKLSHEVALLCADTSNQLFVSLLSVWEMQIKLQVGKLELPTSIEEIVERQEEDNNVKVLSIEMNHILKLVDLPDYHRDPFDRLLITQAVVEDLAQTGTLQSIL